MNVFVITVMTLPRDKQILTRSDQIRSIAGHRDQRTWGWYPSYAEAEFALMRNLTDMHETCYDTAVIEEFPAGVCVNALHEHWFEYDMAVNGYRKTPKPDDLKSTVNFGMG